MQFNMIVAYDDARGIGKNGGIPWNIPGDLAYFKQMTTDCVVIMGGRTWDSLPAYSKPLSNRINIVIAQTKREKAHRNCISLDMALEIAEEYRKPVYIIGGGAIYKDAVTMPALKKIIITQVAGCFDCDVHFPCIPGVWHRAEIDSTEQYTRFLLRRA